MDKLRKTARKNNEEALVLDRIIEQKTRELDRTKKELKLAKRLSDIGTLAATVAHELRNPLAVIKIALYNIKRKNINKALDNHVLSIEEKIAETAVIINNLLNYSSIKKPDYKNVNFNQLIIAAIDSVRKRVESSGVNISFNTKLKNSFMMDADPFQIKEVLVNIIYNACQAVEERKGRVAVFSETKSNYLIIKIIDNGAGIKKSELKDIFKPFYTAKSKGIGLGLTICDEIVSMHKGSLRVESKKGKGAEFTIKIPVREGKAA